MKKILALILCCAFIFCSCSGKKAVAPKSKFSENPFSCTAEINYSGEVFKAEISCQNSANASLKIVEPASVSGLMFKCTNGEFSANYMGLEFPIEKLGSSAVSIAELIFSALRKPEISNKFLRDSKSKELYLEGEIGSKKYRLTLDENNGAPKQFKVYGMDFEVKFSNFENLE